MKIEIAFLLGLAALGATDTASAGSCKDPWVTRAIVEVRHREPRGSGTTGECDIQRYGSQWRDYPDLVAKVRADTGAPIPKEQVLRPDEQFAAQGRYESRRYPEAQRGLECAGLRNLNPTRKNAPSYEVVPHPAVKHAAEVDMPAHGGNGGGLCKYASQPQVQKWYRENFRL